MGGFEGADHVNGQRVALDMTASNGHLERLDEDHANAAAHGIGVVRESIGWRLCEPTPGRFDLQRAVRIACSAERHGLQVVWTLMHYGTPPDVDLFDEALVPRFASFAAAVARTLGPRSVRAPIYNLVNEIGFLAWAASATNLIHPYRGDPADAGETSGASGYALKRRLVRAVLAGVAAVRAIDPRARFLHIEPAVHVGAPRDRPDLAAQAQREADYQWQAWDMIEGRIEAQLGGSREALDLIGVNHYHSGQWEVGTERRLCWHEQDPRRRPLSALLRTAWLRYRRPLILAETSHVGVGRADWLHDTASEVCAARRAGVPIDGLCLYPLVDRHDWNEPDHWHRSGLWDVAHPADPAAPLSRRLCTDYAAALARWQRILPEDSTTTETPMSHLIVFSHLRWAFVYQRPQHLMVRLGPHHPVLFIEEPVHLDPADGPARIDRIPKGPGVDVLVPRTPIAAGGFHDDQLPVLKPLLAEYLRSHAIDDYLVWFYTPMALPLLSELRPRAVVYDCMDELSAFKDAPRQLRQRETALMKAADLVFTGGPALYEAKRHLHPQVHCLPSSVDAAHFAPAGVAPESDAAAEAERLQGALPRPRLGFFGVIDERLDTALVDALARARPEWQIVMVGPVVKIDPAQLPRHPNLHWLGMQPYPMLPHLMAGWDVCLMPFALNEATRFISPTKTLEYLAGDKPVVSTAVPDVVGLYGAVVRIASDPAGFIAACEAALAEPEDARARRREVSRETVAQSSWDSAAQRVLKEIDSMTRFAARNAGEADASDAPHGVPVVKRTVRHVRHMVIGAGPTGLAAAYHLAQGTSAPAQTLLVERADTVGGWCRSVTQQGYTFDHAGHIMFSNDAYVLDMYERLLGDNVHWQNREAWVYSKNVYTRYPFQGSLYGLPPAVLKECLVGAIEARFGPIDGQQSVPPQTPPANFEEFIDRVWGKGIAKHFATPYNRKLWAVPLAEMETSWLGGRVPLPDLGQMIEGALEPTPAPMGPNARFGYPLHGGFQALMDGFLPLLECELSLRTSVLHVSPSRRTVRFDDGRSISFDALVSTMPLPQLVQACGDEAPAEVQAAARGLRHVAVRCVNLGVRLPAGRERLTDKHWIYYPEETVFHRIFVQGNASPHNNPPGGFGLTCEITYGPSKPLPCEGEALIERAIADCRAVGILGPDDEIECANQVDMPCAYVIYDHARAANVACIRDWFASFGIVLAGRYSEWEYYNSDHAFIAGRRAALQVQAALAPAAVASAPAGAQGGGGRAAAAR
jgi:protoporphyrinogen oxidase/glycosyltransferase involved in cell wall biosynthesis